MPSYNRFQRFLLRKGNQLDREFTLDFADESTYDKVSQHLAKKYGVKPLLALELDAGLQPDEAFPGNFQLSFNLKEMGIPEDLYEDVRVFRSIESNREIVSYEFSKEVSPSGVPFWEGGRGFVAIELDLDLNKYGDADPNDFDYGRKSLTYDDVL